MSRFFTKLALSVLIIVGFTSVSFAQDDANMARPNTKAGSAAWMFEIAGLGSFGLSGFTIANNFGGIPAAGWKYYISDDMALRALLGFSTASSGADTIAPNFHNSSTVFGIAVGIELHTHAVYSTSPYFGAQVSFGTGSNDQTIKNGTETKTSGSSLGIGVLVGFDWYFTKGIAIGGEYMFGFSTASGSTTTTPNAGSAKTVDSPSSTNIGISSGNVHLIVHL
jgi:outer membrane protein W